MWVLCIKYLLNVNYVLGTVLGTKIRFMKFKNIKNQMCKHEAKQCKKITVKYNNIIKKWFINKNSY